MKFSKKELTSFLADYCLPMKIVDGQFIHLPHNVPTFKRPLKEWNGHTFYYKIRNVLIAEVDS